MDKAKKDPVVGAQIWAQTYPLCIHIIRPPPALVSFKSAGQRLPEMNSVPSESDYTYLRTYRSNKQGLAKYFWHGGRQQQQRTASRAGYPQHVRLVQVQSMRAHPRTGTHQARLRLCSAVSAS